MEPKKRANVVADRGLGTVPHRKRSANIISCMSCTEQRTTLITGASVQPEQIVVRLGGRQHKFVAPHSAFLLNQPVCLDITRTHLCF
jgi:hypothetical protein